MNPNLETLRHYIGAKRRWRDLGGAKLEAFQDARAIELVRWVNDRSGFYRAHWAGHDLKNWRALPTVDKRLMMEHFTDFNTAGVTKEAALEVALRAERERDFRPELRGGSAHAMTVGLSSGTSGHRGLFLVSPLETAAWAGAILARALHRPLLETALHGERIAFFLRANSNLYERVGRGRLRFRYFDLMTPIRQAVAELEALDPSVLVAPPSMLLALAKARIRPRQVIAVAEVLEPQDKTALEAAFGVAVHQIYQATEGLIAASCRAERLHLMEDLMVVQLEPAIGDASNSRFSPVLTDLWRRTQPIVRYRLNDVLIVEPSPCACGNPWRTIASIEGRSDDTLEFRGADGPRLVFPDTIRRAVLLASDRITEYAAEQSAPHELHVFLEVAPGSELAAIQAVQESLRRELARYGIRDAKLSVALGIAPQAANIKRRRVKRLR